MNAFLYYSNLFTRTTYFPQDSIAIDQKLIHVKNLDTHTLSIRLNLSIPIHECLFILPSFVSHSKILCGYQAILHISCENEKESLALDYVGDKNIGYSNIFLERISNETFISTTHDSFAHSYIDFFKIKSSKPILDIEFHLFFKKKADLFQHPFLLSLHIGPHKSSKLIERKCSILTPQQLTIPKISQMEYGKKIAQRICGPSSVAMVLKYFNVTLTLQQCIDSIYSMKRDLYGIWPNLVWTAARFGCMGFLTRVTEWDYISHLLDQHIPCIVSIRYDEGELANSPIPKTSGHLLVISGVDSDSVIVNDPAAFTKDSVTRSYSIKEFSTVWQKNNGICIIIFPYDTQ